MASAYEELASIVEPTDQTPDEPETDDVVGEDTDYVCLGPPTATDDSDECGRTLKRNHFETGDEATEDDIEEYYCPIHGLNPRMERRMGEVPTLD